MPRRNYHSVAITLLQFVELPIILASARLGATTREPHPMAFYGVAPSSAPCSPGYPRRRQIVPEYDAPSVEWHKRPASQIAPFLNASLSSTILNTSAPRKSER